MLIHSVRGDDEISFDALKHVYTVRGKAVPISVTKLIQQQVPEEHRFNGRKVILKNLTSWRANASNKHHQFVSNTTDEEAISNVLNHWKGNSAAGTAMHALFEDELNGKQPSAAGHEVEMQQFQAAMVGSKPVRTELSVFVTNASGEAVVAGQIDLLLKDDEGYGLVDFKRTANDLTPNAYSFGKEFLDGKPLNDHYKYSLQLSLYRVMFEAQTGLKVVHDPCILQIHPDLECHQWITATDLTAEARVILEKAGMAV